MRLVLDTSVIISAVRSRMGASSQLLRYAFQQRFDWLVSGTLFHEYEAVLKRPEHLAAARFSTADVDLFLERTAQAALEVKLGNFRRPTLTDPNDEHVMNLAWRGRADFLVTHNLRHFQPAAATLGVDCCLPGVAIRRLET